MIRPIVQKGFSVKRLFVCLFLFSVILLSGAGCRSASGPEFTEAELARMSRVERESRILGGNMLESFRKNDAKGFLKNLPEDARRKFGEQEFQTTRSSVMESQGEIVSFQYLALLNAPLLKTHLWKVVFKRTALRNQEKEYRQEILFRVIYGELNGKPYIVSFGFL